MIDRGLGHAVYTLWLPIRTKDKHIENCKTAFQAEPVMDQWFACLTWHYYEFDVFPASFILLQRET